jgi:hypothetical protein
MITETDIWTWLAANAGAIQAIAAVLSFAVTAVVVWYGYSSVRLYHLERRRDRIDATRYVSRIDRLRFVLRTAGENAIEMTADAANQPHLASGILIATHEKLRSAAGEIALLVDIPVVPRMELLAGLDAAAILIERALLFTPDRYHVNTPAAELSNVIGRLGHFLCAAAKAVDDAYGTLTSEERALWSGRSEYATSVGNALHRANSSLAPIDRYEEN